LVEVDCSSQRGSGSSYNFQEGIGKEKMDTGLHRQGPRGYHKRMKREEMDKDIKETREELNRLMLKWKKM
jgi:hypothetical protein